MSSAAEHTFLSLDRFLWQPFRRGEWFVGKEGLPILVPGIEPRPCGHLSAHISQRGHPTVSIYIYMSIIYVCVRAYGYVCKLNNLLLLFVFIWT
jgi:hypothetical protein